MARLTMKNKNTLNNDIVKYVPINKDSEVAIINRLGKYEDDEEHYQRLIKARDLVAKYHVDIEGDIFGAASYDEYRQDNEDYAEFLLSSEEEWLLIKVEYNMYALAEEYNSLFKDVMKNNISINRWRLSKFEEAYEEYLDEIKEFKTKRSQQ